MPFALIKADDDRTFRFIGELDITNVQQVEDALELEIAAAGDLRLNLSELSFVGSTGIRLFIRLAQTRSGTDSLVLVDPSPTVRRVLDLTELERLPHLEIRSMVDGVAGHVNGAEQAPAARSPLHEPSAFGGAPDGMPVPTCDDGMAGPIDRQADARPMEQRRIGSASLDCDFKSLP
jgi:anti-anti-sigma factor